MNGIHEKQMTKGPAFGPEGVCNPAKELLTYKTPSYKEEVLQMKITPRWKRDRRKVILKVQ